MSLSVYLYTVFFIFFGVWILDCRFYFTLLHFALLLLSKNSLVYLTLYITTVTVYPLTTARTYIAIEAPKQVPNLNNFSTRLSQQNAVA